VGRAAGATGTRPGNIGQAVPFSALQPALVADVAPFIAGALAFAIAGDSGTAYPKFSCAHTSTCSSGQSPEVASQTATPCSRNHLEQEHCQELSLEKRARI